MNGEQHRVQGKYSGTKGSVGRKSMIEQYPRVLCKNLRNGPGQRIGGSLPSTFVKVLALAKVGTLVHKLRARNGGHRRSRTLLNAALVSIVYTIDVTLPGTRLCGGVWAEARVLVNGEASGLSRIKS
jgi:hypothetical protein